MNNFLFKIMGYFVLTIFVFSDLNSFFIFDNYEANLFKEIFQPMMNFLKIIYILASIIIVWDFLKFLEIIPSFSSDEEKQLSKDVNKSIYNDNNKGNNDKISSKNINDEKVAGAIKNNEKYFMINKIEVFFDIYNVKHMIKVNLSSFSLDELQTLFKTLDELNKFKKYLYDNKSNISIVYFSKYEFILNKIINGIVHYLNNVNDNFDKKYFTLIDKSLVESKIKISEMLFLEKKLNNEKHFNKINILKNKILNNNEN